MRPELAAATPACRCGYGGRITVPVTIPASATAGQHKLIAVGAEGSHAQITITVN